MGNGKRYHVITESGADYDIDFRRGFWEHRESGHERLWNFKVAKHYNVNTVPWDPDYPFEWEAADEPVVGRRMYVSGKDGWRVSTRVVSVEEVAE